MVEETNKYFPDEPAVKYTPKENSYGRMNGGDSDSRGLLIWWLIYNAWKKEEIYMDLLDYIEKY